MTDPAPLTDSLTAVIEDHLRDIEMGGMVTGIIGAFEYTDFNGVSQVHVFDPVLQPIHRGAGMLSRISKYVELVTTQELVKSDAGWAECEGDCDDCECEDED